MKSLMNLLKKEMLLSGSPLAIIFLSFSVMTFVPGYPILVGAFFVCFGIFQSFQYGREANDVLYTALLPVKKSDVVKAKFIYVSTIQMIAFVLFSVFTVLRMTVMTNVGAYLQNAMMNANLAFLGYVLVIYSLFNLCFVSNFFKTAYKFGKPFVLFIVCAFLFISMAEAIHFFPGMSFLNTPNEGLGIQTVILICGIVIYTVLTTISFTLSKKRFEKIDL